MSAIPEDTSNGVVTIQWTLFQVSSHLTSSIWHHNERLIFSNWGDTDPHVDTSWFLGRLEIRSGIVHKQLFNVQTMIFIMTTSKFGNYKAAMRICLWRVQSPYHPPSSHPREKLMVGSKASRVQTHIGKEIVGIFVSGFFSFFFWGSGGGGNNQLHLNGANHVICIISIIFYVPKMQFAPNVITCNALD